MKITSESVDKLISVLTELGIKEISISSMSSFGIEFVKWVDNEFDIITTISKNVTKTREGSSRIHYQGVTINLI